ncbi:unnamed protein product [Lota lota]
MFSPLAAFILSSLAPSVPLRSLHRVSTGLSPAPIPVISEQREGLGFRADLRELYSIAVAHGNPGKRKRVLSEDHNDDSPLAAEGQEAEHAASHAPTPAARGQDADCTAARGQTKEEEDGRGSVQMRDRTGIQRSREVSGIQRRMLCH